MAGTSGKILFPPLNLSISGDAERGCCISTSPLSATVRPVSVWLWWFTTWGEISRWAFSYIHFGDQIRDAKWFLLKSDNGQSILADISIGLIFAGIIMIMAVTIIKSASDSQTELLHDINPEENEVRFISIFVIYSWNSGETQVDSLDHHHCWVNNLSPSQYLPRQKMGKQQTTYEWISRFIFQLIDNY